MDQARRRPLLADGELGLLGTDIPYAPRAVKVRVDDQLAGLVGRNPTQAPCMAHERGINSYSLLPHCRRQ